MTIDQRTTRTRLTAAALATGVGALLTVPALAAPASAAETGPAQPGTAQEAAQETAQSTGWVRAGHLSPGTPKADITLTPFSGGDPLTLRGVAFSDVTDYLRVPTGLYTLAIRAEDQPDAQPMVTANVEVTEGSASTIIATGEEGPAQVQVVSDDLTPPTEGTAKVRLISAASASEPVTARVAGGPVLAEDVTTGSATGYAEVAAQTWDIDVTAGSTEAPAARIPVEAGGVYTLLVLGDDADGLQLQAIQDSAGAGTMPEGGVDTGGGGSATATAGGPADVAVAPAAAWGFGVTGLAAGIVLLGVARPRPAREESTG